MNLSHLPKAMDTIDWDLSLGRTTGLGEVKTLNSKLDNCRSGEPVAQCTILLLSAGPTKPFTTMNKSSVQAV